MKLKNFAILALLILTCGCSTVTSTQSNSGTDFLSKEKESNVKRFAGPRRVTERN